MQVAGNPRIDAVPDDFLKLFDRPALAYRGRQVIDVAANQVVAIAVHRPARIQTEQQWGVEIESSGRGCFRLTNADAGKATPLVNDLSRLEVASSSTIPQSPKTWRNMACPLRPCPRR